ncbi:MAG: hypothetical protein Q9176_004007 [Flavoplaca citrina]
MAAHLQILQNEIGSLRMKMSVYQTWIDWTSVALGRDTIDEGFKKAWFGYIDHRQSEERMQEHQEKEKENSEQKLKQDFKGRLRDSRGRFCKSADPNSSMSTKRQASIDAKTVLRETNFSTALILNDSSKQPPHTQRMVFGRRFYRYRDVDVPTLKRLLLKQTAILKDYGKRVNDDGDSQSFEQMAGELENLRLKIGVYDMKVEWGDLNNNYNARRYLGRILHFG